MIQVGTFQADAFQQLPGDAFQPGAFQFTAFQTSEAVVPPEVPIVIGAVPMELDRPLIVIAQALPAPIQQLRVRATDDELVLLAVL